MAAVTADRVIVELEAKLDRYEANVRRAEQKFDRATRNISNDAKRMEREVSRNADAVGARFRALAGTFAAAFSLREVQQLADGYTRFTNQLKVAGLEGKNLASVQGQLFDSAQKYGAELESLGTLYSRGAQVSKELGASNAELLQFTNGVAAALKVQGSSANEARGALLQLSQALGSGIVRAEEFNSVNEGALPILKAVAANMDAAGGSVAKLKTLVNDGKVTSEAFFRAFLAGSADLEKQAEKAALTIGNSFTVLNNALGKYIGEADQSLSATEKVSAAIISLSENLDTVAAALGVLSAILLGRFTAGMLAGAASTGVASTALFALQARAIGAATTMEALALTSSTAGRAMLAAFGGPVGLAVTALAAAITLAIVNTDELRGSVEELDAGTRDLAQTNDDLRAKLEAAGVATDAFGEAAAGASGEVKSLDSSMARAIGTARGLISELARLDVAKTQAALRDVQRERERIEGKDLGGGFRQRDALGGIGGGTVGFSITKGKPAIDANDQARLDALDRREKRLQENLALTIAGAVNNVIGEPAPAATGGGGAAPAGDKKKKTKTSRGPSAEELARRFEDDVARGELELKQALADVIGTIEARREVERERIRVERDQVERSIKTDKDLTAAQRDRLIALNDQIAAARLAAVEAEREREAIEDAANLRQEDLRNQVAVLSLQSDLAKTAKKRREIELRILDLQYEEERVRLQAIIDNKRLADAEREAARRRLISLDEQQDLDRERTRRSTAGPLERYRDRLNRSPEELAEQAEQWTVDTLEQVQDRISGALQKAIGVKDPILGGIIDMFIEQVILRPIADAFANAQGGGGGIGGLLASIGGSILSGGGGVGGGIGGGRASGGHVSAGRLYRVNEQGVEGFQPAGSGKIIPLGRMRGAGGGGGVVFSPTFNIDASGVNPDGFAEHIVSRVRRETVAIVGEGMKRVSKGVPARLAQYQRDGN